MGIVKITEKSTTNNVKDSASVLITQPETVNGAMIESVRRAGLSALIEALYLNGLSTKIEQDMNNSVATMTEFRQYLGIEDDS